jgi:hypothetical protein
MPVVAKALTICTAPTSEQPATASRQNASTGVDPVAERSMQPLRRGRILRLGACPKAFARTRKRPETELAALVHRVPAALDPTNFRLHAVDVVRNEIVHRDHLRRPEIRRRPIYGDAETDGK